MAQKPPVIILIGYHGREEVSFLKRSHSQLFISEKSRV